MAQGGETVPLPLPRGGGLGWTFKGIDQNSTAASLKFSSGCVHVCEVSHPKECNYIKSKAGPAELHYSCIIAAL